MISTTKGRYDLLRREAASEKSQIAEEKERSSAVAGAFLLSSTQINPANGGTVFTQPNDADGGSAVLIDKKFDATMAMDRLEACLDLGNVRMKLADTDEGPGLDQDRINLMEREYRKFLAMQLMYPDAVIVPCKLVDEMWHRHILDTAAYREDCATIFGRFLDHFPYFGMRGEEDAQALNDAYGDTLWRYRDAFGEPPVDTWISSDAAKCGRTACKPQKCR